MPLLDFPPEFTEAWFKKNLPFKDKQFATLFKLVQDFEKLTDELDTIENMRPVKEALTKCHTITAEARKLEAVKDLTKVQLGHLVGYGSKAKVVINRLATLNQEGRSDKETRVNADNEMRMTSTAIEAAVNGVAKLKPAFDKLVEEIGDTADKAKKVELQKNLDKVYAALEKVLIKPKGLTWEARSKALKMSALPESYERPAAAPKQADVEKLDTRLRMLIQVRDKVVKEYARAK